MLTKFKWLTFVFCICAVSSISFYQIPKFFASYRQKQSAQTYASIIIESNSIEDVLDYAQDQQTIVAFDLDNTLVHPGQDLGSDQWFSHLFKEKLDSGISRPQALTEILPLYYKIHDHISLQPVEQASLTVLSTLHQKGIISLALTTRSLPMVQRTCIQLKEAGFSFVQSDSFNRELTIQLEKPALLINGIIFCNDNNKGQTLIKTLQACSCKPNTIICVDDKLSHLLDVQKECLLNKIHFIGIRYGRQDSVVAQFDAVRAENECMALFGQNYTTLAATA